MYFCNILRGPAAGEFRVCFLQRCCVCVCCTPLGAVLCMLTAPAMHSCQLQLPRAAGVGVACVLPAVGPLWQHVRHSLSLSAAWRSCSNAEAQRTAGLLRCTAAHCSRSGPVLVLFIYMLHYTRLKS